MLPPRKLRERLRWSDPLPRKQARTFAPFQMRYRNGRQTPFEPQAKRTVRVLPASPFGSLSESHSIRSCREAVGNRGGSTDQREDGAHDRGSLLRLEFPRSGYGQAFARYLSHMKLASPPVARLTRKRSRVQEIFQPSVPGPHHSAATNADATAVLSSFGCEGNVSRRLNSRRSKSMLSASWTNTAPTERYHTQVS